MKEDELRYDQTDKYTLRGKVFKQLRMDILRGKYTENEELRELTIAKEYDVSRTPVREAFRQLELEGLIAIIPNKGAYVLGITEKDVRDIYLIRSSLEGICIRKAMENITPDIMDELEENMILSNFHAKKNRGDQMLKLDKGFHQILYETCDSKILERMLKDLHDYVSVVCETNLSDQNRVLSSNEEHAKIFRAMQEKDPVAAEDLMNEHIVNAYENIVARKNKITIGK